MMTACGKSELCIFDKAPAQVVIDSAVFADVHPTTLIEGTAQNIEFVVSGSPNEYLDLNDTFLHVTLRVKNKGGTELGADVDVVPANYLLNALFSDITLSLNDTVIEGGSRLYPYKSTIESVFNFSEDSKKIQLLPSGFSDDTAIRKAWIAKSRVLELCGPLRLDFFNQPKYLIPDISVRLQLQRAKDNFCLQIGGSAANQPIIEMRSAVLYVRRVKVNPAVALGHQMGIMKQNAIYPITKTQLISYTIAKGSMSYFKDNIFSSMRLPKLVVVAFVGAKAFTGDYKSDAFNFNHFSVNSVGLFRDGQAVPYRHIYEPDFDAQRYTRDYLMAMIQNTEQLNTNLNNGVSMDQYANGGYCFFTFNLTPDFCMSQAQQPRDGNLRLDVKFGKQLAESINVIVYGLFDSEIQITKDHEIII